MSEEINNSESLAGLERTLAGFVPASPRVERDRLMFLAGRASAESSGFGGQGSADYLPGTQYSVLSTDCSPATISRNTAHIHNRRRHWLWPASTAVLAATSLALAVALVLQPQPRVLVVERGMPVSQPAVAMREAASPAENSNVAATLDRESATSRVPAENYLRTREVALRMGLDAIGSQQIAAGLAAPPTYGDLLLNLMGSRQSSDSSTEHRENFSNM